MIEVMVDKFYLQSSSESRHMSASIGIKLGRKGVRTPARDWMLSAMAPTAKLFSETLAFFFVFFRRVGNIPVK